MTRVINVRRFVTPVSLMSDIYWHHGSWPHPCWQLESCVPPEKRAHDVMDRLEIVANPSKKERMTSWTGRQFLQNPVSSLTPGFHVSVLRPSEKENPTISTHHTTNTTITHHVQPRTYYSNNQWSDNHNSCRTGSRISSQCACRYA